MTNSEHIFQKTGAMYLEQVLAMPWDRLSRVYGLDIADQTVTVPFFQEKITVSEQGLMDQDGRGVSFDTQVVVTRYLTMCPDAIQGKTDWTAFRDFRDAGPLTVYFRDNVDSVVTRHFSGYLQDLKTACQNLGGYDPELELSYDLVMAFHALPHLPLLLLFNDAEDGFPSSCSLLFQARADALLDPESLAILGAVFARKLIKVPKPSSS